MAHIGQFAYSFSSPPQPLEASFQELAIKTTVHCKLLINSVKPFASLSIGALDCRSIINRLAPQYMSTFVIRNSAYNSHTLRNTKTDLMLPEKTTANGKKCFYVSKLKTVEQPPS